MSTFYRYGWRRDTGDNQRVETSPTKAVATMEAESWVASPIRTGHREATLMRSADYGPYEPLVEPGELHPVRFRSRTMLPGTGPFEGYMVGSDGGESATIGVCEHDVPGGWACAGCAEREGKGAGTRPAGPIVRELLRAVCNHCGSRVWLDPGTAQAGR